MENILEISRLNKSYADFSLKDVSFSLPENSITGFIGMNGSGKTTTIRCILGLSKFNSGNIRIFGQDISTKALKERIGVVLDDGGFYEEFSMTQIKGIVAPAYKNWQEQDYNNYMEKFRLNPKQKISTLSKGMKMKFFLALALSHKAEFLIMDEPTSGLDPLIRSQLLNILVEYMRKNGRAVFFSTHITSDLEQIADRLILIDNGHIVFQQEKDILLDKYRIVKGNNCLLDAVNRNLFLNIKQIDNGFIGLTDKPNEIAKIMPDALVERPSIENIMLERIGRNYEREMSEHKIFKTAIIPAILMIIGLKHFTPNLSLSIIAGISIFIIVSFMDKNFPLF